MAVARRYTIGTLMAVVSLVAIDFAILRTLWPTIGPEVGGRHVTLPLIELLLLVMPKLRRSNPTRPYWVGFHVMGWTGVLTSGLLAWSYPDAFFRPLDFVDDMLASPHSAAGIALLISVAVVLYTTPLLVIALLAGRLSSKYRIAIERR